MAHNKGTTNPGYVNRNKQTVREKTDWPGNDHNQVIYVMRCGNCGFSYGANGTDTHHRRCPNCMKGQPCSNSKCPVRPKSGNCDWCKNA